MNRIMKMVPLLILSACWEPVEFIDHKSEGENGETSTDTDGDGDSSTGAPGLDMGAAGSTGDDGSSAGTGGDSSDTDGDSSPYPDLPAEPYCGDGMIDPGEVCDSENIGEETCSTYWGDPFVMSGEISCSNDCMDFDPGSCCFQQGTMCALNSLPCCDGECTIVDGKTLCK